MSVKNYNLLDPFLGKWLNCIFLAPTGAQEVTMFVRPVQTCLEPSTFNIEQSINLNDVLFQNYHTTEIAFIFEKLEQYLGLSQVSGVSGLPKLS